MVMEERCGKVVLVRRVCDGVMTVVAYDEDVPRFICGYVPPSG